MTTLPNAPFLPASPAKPGKTPRMRLARHDAPAALGVADLLTGGELTPEAAALLLDTAAACKADPRAHAQALAGKSVAMLFEKPSLRTRATFEVGVFRLGGQALYFDHQHSKIGAREPILDLGKNLERWCHAIVARVDSHRTVDALAQHAGIPVINALSDLTHPCQALADMLTLREKFGPLPGLRLAFVGDGNNVCHSLMLLGAALGVHVTVVTPPGAEPRASFACEAILAGQRTGARIEVTHDLAAVEGAHAVYTDTWTSMGCGEQTADRAARFAPYQVGPALMDAAGPGAAFMHCLPAHRGEEVAPEVIDGPASLIYDQAENRLHAQMALLIHLTAS